MTTENPHRIQQTAARRQQVVYISVALSRSLSVMPRTLAQLTRSMFGHGGGGWVDRWPQFSWLIALKISSFDLARFSLRLFLDAQISTLDISSSRELEL